jgi:hypothetical protein
LREGEKPPIKWGDYIAVEKRSGATGGMIVEAVVKVTKLTPTQVVAGRERFYRADGRSVASAFLSRPVARPATKEEYDAFMKERAIEQATRAEERRKRDVIENSTESKLVSELLNDWEPDRRDRLRALGEDQLRLVLDLLMEKLTVTKLDMLRAVMQSKR